MGKNRTLNKKPATRPRKSGTERKRREKVQRDRLTGLGMDAEKVKRLNPRQVKDLLKRPAKVKAG